MHYQNMLCLGDSQTFGARSYGCYPLYLAQELTRRTAYQWRTINRSVNGFTARDLWFMLNEQIDSVQDCYQACVLIGTNDVGNDIPRELFSEYYRQILRTLVIKGYKAIYCGEIPPIHADGHVFFSKSAAQSRDSYNDSIQLVCNEFAQAVVVATSSLDRSHYVDPVHFNEKGNQAVASAFAEAAIVR